jgi:glycosyltransferase involved in cell wall biosynthesis
VAISILPSQLAAGPQLQRTAAAFATATASQNQMRPEQYFRIVAEILQRAPCRVLIVGAGKDTALYATANRDGETVVLEHHSQWQQFIASVPCKVIPVTYASSLNAPPLEPCCVPEGVPASLLQESWDVVIVDAPEGDRPSAPGRQQSIYLASLLAKAGTTVFVHDFERQAEQQFTAQYLKPVDERYGQSRCLAVFSYTQEPQRHSNPVITVQPEKRPANNRLQPGSVNALARRTALRSQSPRRSQPTRRSDKMKIFVLGVPHTQTTRRINVCPFTVKAWYQCRMLRQLGHEVIHLGCEGSDVDCDEHVSVVSEQEWLETYGYPGADYTNTKTDGRFRGYHSRWAENVRQAILQRTSHPWEAIVCCTWGGTQIEATRDLKQFVVEAGIGYRHTWAKYRVFVSYAWMHFHYGLENRFDGSRWYDVVIPNAIDPDLFECSHEKGNDFLFMGRLNDDKGIAIAIDVAKRVGRKLLLVGQGNPERFLKGNPHVSYLPPVGLEERRQLMAKAAAFFCPTQYVEPLGNVAIEAQASGTPVICTDWGGFTESVLHGTTGYRCRTFEQFLWAAKNIDTIQPAACREWAITNFAPQRIGTMFEEYYRMLLDLNDNGWYQDRSDRQQLNWLQRHYPPEKALATV